MAKLRNIELTEGILAAYQNAIESAPDEWSVHVGIHSEWDSGRTTMCHFIDELLDKGIESLSRL